MKEWFEKRKPIVIVLGIVYVLLALFVVSAYVRTDIELIMNGEGGKGLALILIEACSKNLTDVGDNISSMFLNFGRYISALKDFTIFYVIAMGIFLLLFNFFR